ncbi:MAG TPA: S4 domain-containing protein, partial [Burkholderiaceae bacterium]|nr:S4 domain-containing protein [Burkholderiaceae bacterium]
MSSREVYVSAALADAGDDAAIDAAFDAAEADEPLRRQFSVGGEQAGDRLDKVLAQWMPEVSRSRLKQWIEVGAVRVNGATVRPRHAVVAGDHVELEPQPAPDAGAYTPE